MANWEAVRAFSSHQRLWGYRAWLEYELGNFSLGEEYLRKMEEGLHQTTPGPNTSFCVPPLVIAEVYRITGDPAWLEVAEKAASVVLSSEFGIPRFVMPARIGLGLIAVEQADVDAVGEQYDALKAVRGTFLLTLDMGSVDRRLGLFSRTIGDLEQAITHFEEGLLLCRKAGYRPELAWTCCDYADTLLQRNEPGDREKATSLLDESLAISSEVGMRPLMERVLSLQQEHQRFTN